MKTTTFNIKKTASNIADAVYDIIKTYELT